MHPLPRITLACVLGGLLLAGCATGPSVRKNSQGSTSHPTSGNPSPPNTSASASRESPVPEANATTGIGTCDAYLSSYLACHRAARIFPADQLQSRYAAMRSSLLHDSQDPGVRPYLAARCNSLTTQLRQMLDGKSCAPGPAKAKNTR